MDTYEIYNVGLYLKVQTSKNRSNHFTLPSVSLILIKYVKLES